MASSKFIDSLFRIVTLVALIVAGVVLYTSVQQDKVIQKQRQIIKVLESQPCPTNR